MERQAGLLQDRNLGGAEAFPHYSLLEVLCQGLKIHSMAYLITNYEDSVVGLINVVQPMHATRSAC